MIRSIILFIAVLLIVLVSVSNVHPIPLRLFAGEPVNVRLIYLVIFSFLIGVVSTAYFFIMARFHAKRKRAREEDEDGDEL